MAKQPNLNDLMQQLQRAQVQMSVVQEKLKDEVVEASAGGGMVNVKMSGGSQLLAVQIDPSALNADDVEMLQDMIVAAVNEASRSAAALAEKRIGGIAGDLGLPGM
ncbi:MAG: YbaB/EbfC family nucleoid-associated protein [Actinobacteria bacterium]|nr:YbaB/EbfC family nucleoid-associated protein [Actinomycetota bacterium]